MKPIINAILAIICAFDGIVLSDKGRVRYDSRRSDVERGS